MWSSIGRRPRVSGASRGRRSNRQSRFLPDPAQPARLLPLRPRACLHHALESAHASPAARAPAEPDKAESGAAGTTAPLRPRACLPSPLNRSMRHQPRKSRRTERSPAQPGRPRPAAARRRLGSGVARAVSAVAALKVDASPVAVWFSTTCAPGDAVTAVSRLFGRACARATSLVCCCVLLDCFRSSD